MIKEAHAEYETQYAPLPSPYTQATQALYAEQGSNEGTKSYECCKSAQAHFETPQPLEQSRIEEIEDHSVSSNTRTESLGQATSSSARTENLNHNISPNTRTDWRNANSERYARQLAEARAHTAWIS